MRDRENERREVTVVLPPPLLTAELSVVSVT